MAVSFAYPVSITECASPLSNVNVDCSKSAPVPSFPNCVSLGRGSAGSRRSQNGRLFSSSIPLALLAKQVPPDSDYTQRQGWQRCGVVVSLASVHCPRAWWAGFLGINHPCFVTRISNLHSVP